MNSASRLFIALAFSPLSLVAAPQAIGAGVSSTAPSHQIPCSYTLSTTAQSFARSGGPGFFTVTANCDWSAMSTVTWITVDPSRQDDTASLSYNVARNDGDSPRTGSIRILAAQDQSIVGTITVSQDTGCNFKINPAGGHFPGGGGTGGFDATAPAGCPGPSPFLASFNTWVTIESVAGSRVSFSVQGNPGPVRSTFINVDHDNPSPGFTVVQDALDACPESSIRFSPLSVTVTADNTSANVNVTAGQDCSWVPLSTVDWISIPVPQVHRGSGSVFFEVKENTGGARGGAIDIGGRPFAVHQDGLDCPIIFLCHFVFHCGSVSGGLVDVGHSFRDKVLARSARGKRYTDLYYHFSREAVTIMLSNPLLLLRSRDMITRFKPVLELMVNGQPIGLTQQDLSDIDEFLSDFSGKGTPALTEALDDLRKDLKDPAVRSDFNISIVDGPKRQAALILTHSRLLSLECSWMLFGTFGFIFSGFGRRPGSRRPRPRLRSPLIVLSAGLIAGPVLSLSGHPSNKTSPTIASSLSYLTYLGGSSADSGSAIATDSSGNAYVAGFTGSPNFPILGATQATLAGGEQDAFVCKLSPSGKLIYSTYLGGADQDNATAIAVDSTGSAYVTGFTRSTNFPVRHALQPQLKGDVNAFVAKLDPTGAIVYSTYLGGSLDDVSSGIAVDSAGNAYVTGVATSSDFPIAGAAQVTIGGESNAFIAKISPDGSRLVYSTFLGGRDTDGASSIAVDTAGQTYITGVASSRNFPTVNALRPSHGGGFFDAFVAKLNAAGSQFLYSTYLGGTGEDRGLRIAIDSGGNAYVTGDTDSTDFPTASPIQPSNKGISDAFIAKLNPTGSALVYSTYLGGGLLDGGTGIAVDPDGIAYVTGFTASPDFPLTSPTQAPFGGGGFDAFVAVADPAGSAFLYSSYVGGSGIDSGFGVASDAQGGIYIMGQTNSRDLPVSNALQISYAGDPTDVFVARIKFGPLIIAAQVIGKRLLVSGIGFDAGATVLLNGDAERTANDAQNPATLVVARKAGKLIAPGQMVTLQVKNSDGSISNQFTFTRPAA